MVKRILIINGPNLNLLGSREPETYGSESFESFLSKLGAHFSGKAELTYFQSNIEGELVTAIQTGKDYDGVVLNAAAYTHTSVAIGDAVAAISTPVIEVHISNVAAREDFRQINHISAKCRGSIAGLGLKGYLLAVEFIISQSDLDII